MNNIATLLTRTGRALFRMEVTFVLLLLAMATIGRANDLDARIKLALVDAIQSYRAAQVITDMDRDAVPANGRGATAALPRGR